MHHSHWINLSNHLLFSESYERLKIIGKLAYRRDIHAVCLCRLPDEKK